MAISFRGYRKENVIVMEDEKTRVTGSTDFVWTGDPCLSVPLASRLRRSKLCLLRRRNSCYYRSIPDLLYSPCLEFLSYSQNQLQVIDALFLKKTQLNCKLTFRS